MAPESNPEYIPTALDTIPSAFAGGKMSYDMGVNVEQDQTVRSGILNRIPPEVQDKMIGYPGRVRLVIEIYQT